MSFLSAAQAPLVPLAAPGDDGPGNPWLSWSYVQQNWGSTLQPALEHHASVTARAVLLALIVALPLSVVAYWIRPLTGPILALSGILYTIPSLALLSFLAPLVGANTTLVLIALVLYALLVLIRNALAGLTGVPEEVKDAAKGMGYGRFGRLWRIELPLALPSIITGVRLATVSTVALLTVGSLVGQGGLGDLILGGFRNNFYKAEILTGTIMTVLLALVFDLILAGVGRLLTPWTRERAA